MSPAAGSKSAASRAKPFIFTVPGFAAAQGHAGFRAVWRGGDAKKKKLNGNELGKRPGIKWVGLFGSPA